MDGKRFDVVARLFAHRSSRRGAVATVTAAALAAVGVSDAAAGYTDTCTRFRLARRAFDGQIAADDQLRVYLNGNKIVDTGIEAGDFGPFNFYARKGDTLRVRATDYQSPYYQLSAMYLHCIRDGSGKRRLNDRIEGDSGQRLPKDFFDKTITL
ncbi:MAG TPA: hypothetical protein VER37_06705 [Thermomicrobiales bacterium]|nr:hypothetical protein [Thermomicrobiales bacterium]